MKRIFSLLLVITLATTFLLCACTSPEEPESEEPQEPVESVESSDLPEDVEKTVENAETQEDEEPVEDEQGGEETETYDETPLQTDYESYYDILDLETRQKAEETAAIFLYAFNIFDEEILKTVTTEKFFNEMIEFKRNNPTEEEMAEAVKRETDIFYNTLSNEQRRKTFEFMGLIGIIYAWKDGYFGFEHAYVSTGNPIDGYYFPDEPLRIAFISTLGIKSDNIATAQPNTIVDDEIVSYKIRTAIELVINENGEFLVLDFGLTHT